MRMAFAVGMGRDESVDQVGGLAKAAEDAGFSYVTFVDQPGMSRDVYACMSVAAMATRSIRIAQGVTDPSTYSPWVIANATATIRELSGGRAFVGLGAGGPYGKSMRPLPVKQVRAAVQFIKEFTAGREAEFDGIRMRSEWIRTPLPVYIGTAGPRMLQMAGEVADGVMLASNADPVVLKWQLEQIERGAAKAGRDPADIDVWARGMIYLTDSPEHARREVSGYAVNSARALYRRFSLKNGPELEELRRRLEREHPGLIDECKRVHDVWTPDQHERVDTPASAAVSDRIIDVQHLAGTADEIRHKLQRIGELGIRTFATVTYTIIDKKAMLEAMGRQVIPAFDH